MTRKQTEIRRVANPSHSNLILHLDGGLDGAGVGPGRPRHCDGLGRPDVPDTRSGRATDVCLTGGCLNRVADVLAADGAPDPLGTDSGQVATGLYYVLRLLQLPDNQSPFTVAKGTDKLEASMGMTSWFAGLMMAESSLGPL